mmetsp:Transcript_12926/g.51513  ORF Transcript_12926/g.51513 Transcript_12926/m.51513 type:complete len:80 (-) Transcript_12926:28-267(-)
MKRLSLAILALALLAAVAVRADKDDCDDFPVRGRTKQWKRISRTLRGEKEIHRFGTVKHEKAVAGYLGLGSARCRCGQG